MKLHSYVSNIIVEWDTKGNAMLLLEEYIQIWSSCSLLFVKFLVFC